MLTNSSLQVFPGPYGDSNILCNVSSGSVVPLIPTSLRKQLFSALHDISNPEVRVSRRLISALFVWPGMAKTSPLVLSLHSVSAEQDPDTHQILSTEYSDSWKAFCSRSH